MSAKRCSSRGLVAKGVYLGNVFARCVYAGSIPTKEVFARDMCANRMVARDVYIGRCSIGDVLSKVTAKEVITLHVHARDLSVSSKKIFSINIVKKIPQEQNLILKPKEKSCQVSRVKSRQSRSKVLSRIESSKNDKLPEY